MVYHMVNENIESQEQMCYLGIVYYGDEMNQFDHGCKCCSIVYNTLNRLWPGVQHAIGTPGASIEKFNTSRLWEGVLQTCGEKSDKFGVTAACVEEEGRSLSTCPKCDQARMSVGRLWVDVSR